MAQIAAFLNRPVFSVAGVQVNTFTALLLLVLVYLAFMKR